MERLILSTKQELLDFLELHNQMSGADFMTSPKTQKERAAFEFHHSSEVTFDYKGTIYTYYAITRCTNSGVHYSLNVYRLYEKTGKFERLDCTTSGTQRSYIELLRDALLEVM